MNWKEFLCLDKRVCIKLPENFERPSKEIVEKWFPYPQKPQEIFADPNAYSIFTLNILGKALEEKQVYSAILEIQRLISHMYPESVEESSQLFITESGKAGYFSFTTGGLDGDKNHYMFVLPVRKKMLLGSFHFLKDVAQREKLIFFEAMKSIKANENIAEEK